MAGSGLRDILWLLSVRLLENPQNKPAVNNGAGGRLPVNSGFVIYSKSGQDRKLFSWDWPSGSTGQESLLVDMVALGGSARMDGSLLAWSSTDGNLYYTYANQPDISITSSDITFGDANPVEGETFDVTVTVHNIGVLDATADLTVHLYDGNPDDGGTQLGSDQVIVGGIVRQGSSAVVFSDLPVGPAGDHTIYVQVDRLPNENPVNNTAAKPLSVRDSDTEGPAISNVVVSEYTGDGDGIIEEGEQIRMTWSLTDPSGIASTELIVDGSAVTPITGLGSDNPLTASCEAILDPLAVGSHNYAIRATDADEDLDLANSAESSEYPGSFEVRTRPEVYLEATLGNDVIGMTPGTPGGAWHQVDINSIVTSYDPAVITAIYIDGLGGTDQITTNGTSQNEAISLEPGSVDVVGQTYELHVTSVEEISVDAGSGNDQVTMAGSTGSNRLYSYADYARLSDSPRTFSYRTDGFDTVTVNAPGSGRDYAFLYDSPQDDVLDANPDRVILNRAVGTADATTTTATGFQRAYVYATNGGTDTATLTGSDTTRNRFYGYSDYSILTESRRAFYFYARGFDDVAAESPGDGYSYAYLHDSPDVDALTATPTSATIDRAAGWSDTTANGFKRVYAYSPRGGDDTAELTGSASGGNRFRGYPTYSTLTDTARSFYLYARGFRSVTATGSPTDTSSDRAYLYDSKEADTLFGRSNSAILRDKAETNYQCEALYFDLVYARSSDGEANDTVNIDDSLIYNLIQSGIW